MNVDFEFHISIQHTHCLSAWVCWNNSLMFYLLCILNNNTKTERISNRSVYHLILCYKMNTFKYYDHITVSLCLLTDYIYFIFANFSFYHLCSTYLMHPMKKNCYCISLSMFKNVGSKLLHHHYEPNTVYCKRSFLKLL